MRVDEVIVKPKTGQPVVATFDEKDLQLVLFEALMGLKRPPGISRDEALASIERQNPAVAEGLGRAASATMHWIVERLQAASPEAVEAFPPTQGPVQ